MAADVDHDLLLKTLEERKQAAFGKQMVLAVHQLGYFRLVDVEQSADFPLFQFLRLQDQADKVGEGELRALARARAKTWIRAFAAAPPEQHPYVRYVDQPDPLRRQQDGGWADAWRR